MHIDVDELLKTMSIDEVLNRIEESENLLIKRRAELASLKQTTSEIFSVFNNNSYDKLNKSIQNRMVEVGNDPIALAELERQKEIIDDLFNMNITNKKS